MSNKKEIKIRYSTGAPKATEGNLDEFYRVEVALKAPTTVTIDIPTGYINPFVQVTIQGNNYPCVAWVEAIAGNVVSISCKTESAIQCTGVLFVTICDASTATGNTTTKS